MKNLILLILTFFTFNTLSAQYVLSNEQLNSGLSYITKDFRDPNSAKINSVFTSTKKFNKECFTWAKYDISGRNGFGGYTRNEYIVFFYDGEPIYVEDKDGTYFMFANNDKVADQVIATAEVLGYYISECAFEIEKKKRDAEELLKTNADKKAKQISEDENRYELIDQLLLEKKILEAKSEMDKLNFPENYKNKQKLETEYLSFMNLKKEREVLEDKLNISNIRKLLNLNDIEKVVQLWQSLHTKTSYQNVKDSIYQFIIRNETGNIPISLSKTDVSKFIELNKVQIANSYTSLTKDTNIIVEFDKRGQCLQKETYTWNSNVFKKYSDEFFTYQIVKIPISMKIMDKLIESKNQVVFAGTEKVLALSLNRKHVYKVNFFTIPLPVLLTLAEQQIVEQQMYDAKLPTNQIRVVEFYTHDLFANEIKIDSREIQKSYNKKLSLKIFRIIRRTGLIASGIVWSGLRILENQSIK